MEWDPSHELVVYLSWGCVHIVRMLVQGGRASGNSFFMDIGLLFSMEVALLPSSKIRNDSVIYE